MTLNLDKLAAERAQAIVRNAAPGKMETLERLDTKALGVLQEQGVYALMLFLLSRTSEEKQVAPLIREQLYQALNKLPAYHQNAELNSLLSNDPQPESILQFYTNQVLNNLDITLLVRDLYEQILIYTRYGAKAAGG